MEYFENLTRLVAVYNPGERIDEEMKYDQDHEENLKRLNTFSGNNRATFQIKGLRVASQENPTFHHSIAQKNQS